MVKLNKGNNKQQSEAKLDFLLKELESRDRSGLGLPKLDLARDYVALASMLQWDSDLSDIDKANIVWDVLDDIAGRKGITRKSLFQKLNVAEQRILAAGTQDYVVFSFISIAPNIEVARRIIYDATITLSASCPRKFRLNYEAVIKQADLPYIKSVPQNYQALRIRVNAHTYATAFSKAEECLNLLRGIWNFVENRSQGIRWSSGSTRRPVNRILTLPLYTIHKPSGDLATDTWWYDSSIAIRPPAAFGNTGQMQVLQNEEKTIRKMLSRLPYRQQLETAFRRYVSALDMSDWTNSFLHLWSILEFLTGLRESDSHSAVVKRSTFWYRPDDFSELNYLIVDSLRKYRNSYVHSSERVLEAEIAMYVLKSYVEDMMQFHLNNVFRFKTIQDSALALDLPNKLSGLKSSVQELEKSQHQISRKVAVAKKALTIFDP